MIAARTTVTVDRSRTDLERLLAKHGVTDFAYGTEGDRGVVTFRLGRRAIRFDVTIPPLESFYYTPDEHGEPTVRARSHIAQVTARNQVERQRWRALLQVIKGRVEAVEAGITSLDDAFLAQILLPSGQTVSEYLRPQLDDVYERGVMPSLLPGVRAEVVT